MTLLLSRGEMNGLFKFQPYLVSIFGVIAIDIKKSKTIDFSVPIWGKIQALV